MVEDRSTKWYQGGILSKEDFNQIRNDISLDGAIMISHDCDIANGVSIEPNFEFILFDIVDSNGSFLYGKNPRTLHLPIIHNLEKKFIELLATKKISTPKENIIQFEPDQNFTTPLESIEILQSWLAARYKRHALPNSLVERLRAITEYLEKNLKQQLESILGVWIDYQPRKEILSEERYELWIYFVYSTNENNARVNASELVNKIKEKFLDLLTKNPENKISLVSCESYSESEFTLLDMRTTFQYRYDYLSYRTNPSGPNP